MSLLPATFADARSVCATENLQPVLLKEPDDLKAMMKIGTPWHAEHQLDQLAGQFEHWRQTRPSPRSRIPQALWDQAVSLTQALSPSRVATQLRLGWTDL